VWLLAHKQLDLAGCTMSVKNHRLPVTYSEVFHYLTGGKYAEGCTNSRKRAIRKFSENISLEDGILYYLQYEGKTKKKVTLKRQWIQDKNMQKEILQSVHDDKTGGCHFGRDKMRKNSEALLLAWSI